MIRLPRWVLNNRYPSAYDRESVTAIEMVAKLYGAMNELIDEYNAKMEEIDTHEQEMCEAFSCFRNGIIKLVNDYIKMLDAKVEDAEDYMKTNLAETVKVVVDELSAKLQEEIVGFEEAKAQFIELMNEHTAKINEAIDYLHTNIEQTVMNYIQDGNVTFSLIHNPETEELTLAVNLIDPDEVMEVTSLVGGDLV